MGAGDQVKRGVSRAGDGAGEALDSAGHHAQKVTDHTWFRALARTGFVVSGLINALIGVTAILLATGGSSESADQQGAISLVEAVPGGVILLWICAAGAFALAIWFLLDAFVQRRRLEGADAAKAMVKRLGTAVIYIVLGVGIVSALMGSGGNTEQSADQASSSIIDEWWGATLIVLVGLAIAGAGVFFIVKGIRRTFTETLDLGRAGRKRKLVVAAGVIGHVARGIAFVLIGALCVIAVVNRDPEAVSGLAGTLQQLASQPYGPYLLIAIGVGMIFYGIYMAFRARYENLDRDAD